MRVREAKMVVQFVTNTTLPSGQQSNAQPVPAGGTANDAANKPLLGNTARSVPESNKVATPNGERRADRTGRQGEEAVSPQQVLESLRLTNRRAQLDFDRDLDAVVLQIVDTRTEEVLETIPSEELILQLRRLAGPQDEAQTPDASGLVVDKSI